MHANTYTQSVKAMTLKNVQIFINGLDNIKEKKGGTCIYYFFSNVPKYISTDTMTVVLQE